MIESRAVLTPTGSAYDVTSEPAPPESRPEGHWLQRRSPGRIRLKDLRQAIARIEGRVPALAGTMSAAPWCFGVPAIDAMLGEATEPAETGLDQAGLHEIGGAAHGDGPAAAGFGLALLSRLAKTASGGRGTILWCLGGAAAREFGRPYGPGLELFGLAPGHFLFVHAARDRDGLWAMEEGLKSRALLAVVGELGTADLTATRRLALAAAASRTAVLLLRQGARPSGTAAATVWRVGAEPSAPHPFDAKAPGRMRFALALARTRRGRPGCFIVDFDYATRSFHLASAMADRAAPARCGPARPAVRQHRTSRTG